MLLSHNPTDDEELEDALNAYSAALPQPFGPHQPELARVQAVVSLKNARTLREAPLETPRSALPAAWHVLALRLVREPVLWLEDYRTENDQRGVVLVKTAEVESITLQELPMPEEPETRQFR